MINKAALSLTEPPGFKNSAFPKIVQPVSSEREGIRIKGVLPIVAENPFWIDWVEVILAIFQIADFLKYFSFPSSFFIKETLFKGEKTIFLL
jgi:hypothetical protein